MQLLAHIVDFLEGLAPPRLAAEWDNVGLLAGDSSAEVRRLMTCLTVTRDSAAEAVAEHADLIVTHHPLPFRPIKRITSETLEGGLLWQLISARIAIYSAHTAFDSAAAGINQRLAEGLGLSGIAPLQPEPQDADHAATAAPTGRPAPAPVLGSGRYGDAADGETLRGMAERVKRFLGVAGLHVVGRLDAPARRLAIACGSGGEFLDAALRAGCDALLTGEARFHTCLAAQADGVSLILAGHFASERFAQQRLADELARQFPNLTVWCSRREADPLAWI